MIPCSGFANSDFYDQGTKNEVIEELCSDSFLCLRCFEVNSGRICWYVFVVVQNTFADFLLALKCRSQPWCTWPKDNVCHNICSCWIAQHWFHTRVYGTQRSLQFWNFTANLPFLSVNKRLEKMDSRNVSPRRDRCQIYPWKVRMLK